MLTYLVKINDTEYPVKFVRFREKDCRHDHRNTVTLVAELTHAEVVALFTAPGEWSVIKRYEPTTDAEGNTIQEPDVVMDCTGYEVLCRIRDDLTGLVEVVVGTITDSEALAELLEVLNG